MRPSDDIGAYHHATAKIVGNLPDSENVRTMLIRSIAIRTMEECVELLLCTGNSPGGIFAAVADALHNEALKAKRYVSKLGHPLPDHPNIVGELVDVHIGIDYIRYIAGISQQTYQENVDAKLKICRHLAEQSQLVMLPDGRMYKREANRA